MDEKILVKPEAKKQASLVYGLSSVTYWSFQVNIISMFSECPELARKLADAKRYIFALRCTDYCFYEGDVYHSIPIKYLVTEDHIKRKSFDGKGSANVISKLMSAALIDLRSKYDLLYDDDKPTDELNEYLASFGLYKVEKLEKILKDKQQISKTLCARLLSISDSCVIENTKDSKSQSESEYNALKYDYSPFEEAELMHRKGKGKGKSSGELTVTDDFIGLMIASAHDFKIKNKRENS